MCRGRRLAEYRAVSYPHGESSGRTRELLCVAFHPAGECRPVQLMGATKAQIDPSAPLPAAVFRWRFSFPYRKIDWDKWDNWDTRRKPAWLSESDCPCYAFVTGTLLGQVGHFGVRTFHNVASFDFEESRNHAHLMRPGVWSGSVGRGAKPSQRRSRSRTGV